MKKSKAASLAATCLLTSLVAVQVQGAEIDAGISVGVSWTDNVFLQTAPNDEEDLAYQVAPFVNFVHESPTFDADLRYRLEWFDYDTTDISRTYHMGEGSVTGKLWEESLAIQLGARRQQTLRDPDGVIPSGRLPISNNLVDRDEVFINPRLERKLGGSVTLSADYLVTEGSYDDPLLQDDTNHHGSASLQNYDAGQGFSWALRYDRRKTEYELSRDWESQQASAELGFWVNGQLRVFGSGGKESPWDDPLNSDLEDEFWEAGFAYSAGESLSAEFAAGERSFGSSWRGDLDYTFSRGSMTINYSESPTTTGFNSSGGRRNILDPNDLDEFLDTPGRAESYLSERLGWNLNVELRRTELQIAVFSEERSGRIQADGTPLADQSQKGVRLNLAWQAGVRTAFGASGSYIEGDTDSFGLSEFITAGLNVEYRLGSQTAISLAYSYVEQQPKGTISSSRDYVNNMVSLLFTYTMQ